MGLLAVTEGGGHLTQVAEHRDCEHVQRDQLPTPTRLTGSDRLRVAVALIAAMQAAIVNRVGRCGGVQRRRGRLGMLVIGALKELRHAQTDIGGVFRIGSRSHARKRRDVPSAHRLVPADPASAA